MADEATILERHPKAIIVRVQSETLDEKTTAAVRTATSAAAEADPQAAIILDLSRVAFLPSMSLGSLVQLSQACKANGRRLVLAGLQPFVRDLLAVTRLNRLFEIHDDVSTLLAGKGSV